MSGLWPERPGRIRSSARGTGHAPAGLFVAFERLAARPETASFMSSGGGGGCSWCRHPDWLVAGGPVLLDDFCLDPAAWADLDALAGCPGAHRGRVETVLL